MEGLGRGSLLDSYIFTVVELVVGAGWLEGAVRKFTDLLLLVSLVFGIAGLLGGCLELMGETG